MNDSLHWCRANHYDGVVLVGHPEYYPRFGYVAAEENLGLTCDFDCDAEAWMALELKEGSMKDGGKVTYHQAFDRFLQE